MTVINKHIFKIQFLSVAVAFLGMGLIDIVLASLNELNYRTNETYTASPAIQYVLYTAPARLYVYSPYIILIGVLFATGQMANDRELVIYESATLMKMQIVKKILIAPIVWTCLFFAFGETIAPYYELKAKEIRDLAASKTSTQYGVWHKDQNSFYFFNALDQNGKVTGGYRIESSRSDAKPVTTKFNSLVYVGEGVWQANGTLDKIHTETGVEKVEAEIQHWSMQVTPKLLLTKTNSGLNLSLFTLFTYTRYLSEQGLNNNQYALKFWQKIVQPLLTLSLVCLGITFIFGPLRESSMGARVFSGLMVSLVLNIIQSVLSPLALSFAIPTYYVALTPLLIVILLNIVLLLKAK
ncbi:LPS export ABC transporter permease LptG [Reinekea marina]|uniref:LPS export ABC transporter permease LptG n=1 Tax=Reinekea marina TaxID=1310421 RepID=A0ABV7WVR6_9GAMM|nr:LPS export ABC transporter permease LptG [Reinekea marina]MDN3649324.1 LPS export ABC transporter permease LptG [Reinekea marina]